MHEGSGPFCHSTCTPAPYPDLVTRQERDAKIPAELNRRPSIMGKSFPPLQPSAAGSPPPARGPLAGVGAPAAAHAAAPPLGEAGSNGRRNTAYVSSVLDQAYAKAAELEAQGLFTQASETVAQALADMKGAYDPTTEDEAAPSTATRELHC